MMSFRVIVAHYSKLCSLALALLLGVLPASLNAQRYPFSNLGIEQGLIQSQVFDILQDSSGHLWAATLGGLSSYDGKTFRSYTVRDGLPSNTIMMLACDAKGQLWIGTGRGISCYDGRRFRNFLLSSPDNPDGNRIAQLEISKDGTVWCAAGKFLYAIRNGKASVVTIPGMAGRVQALAATGTGFLIASVGSTKLYNLVKDHWDSIPLPGNRPLFVHRITQDNAGRVILLSGNGLFRLDNNDWNLLLPRKSNTEPLLYGFTESLDGSYWVSTSSGIVRLSGETKQYFNRKTGLTDLLVYDLLRDKEGNIWIGTNGEGLYRFSGAPFTTVGERMGLDGPQVSSIAQDKRGITYFGSYDGGLYKYIGGQVTSVPFPNGIKRASVACMELQSDILWIGTQSLGLWRYNTATGSMARVVDERIGTSIPNMTQGPSGIVVGSNKRILLINESGELEDLPINEVSEAFAFIGKDSLLIATMDGLKLLSKDTVTRFFTQSAADSGQIVCITAREGTVWMGTSDNGLFGYHIPTRQTMHITRKEGLRSDFIYNVYASPDGSVWAGTGFGICQIHPDVPRPRVMFYGHNEGLTGMESNRNAVYPLPDGSIWFGTTGGAQLYHPHNIVASTQPVSLQLQSVTLFGDLIKDTSWYESISPFYGVPQGLRLPYQKNNLSFSFNAVSMSGNDALSYRYRLEGLPAPWSEWSTNNTVTFSALPPGKYDLLVQSSIDGQHPQAKTLRYPFEIITPFHQTSLFRFLIIAACIILGVLLQYLAARGKRRRLAQIEAVRREEQAKVRQRTAEDFHDEVGNKLTRINVLTNVLRSKVSAAPDATRIIDQIQDNAGQLYSGTRDILWALQPSNDNLYQVMHRIRDFGRDLFGDTDTEFAVGDIPSSWKDYRLPMDASRNLIMIFKEALNNTLKYSGATHVAINTRMQEGGIVLMLRDNGEGFDTKSVRLGQGINNMKTRAGRLGGTLEIDTEKHRGTSITLQMKIPLNKG
jgi:signal transduction histidine kinase/ligand-binding sensor domain-containing protein